MSLSMNNVSLFFDNNLKYYIVLTPSNNQILLKVIANKALIHQVNMFNTFLLSPSSDTEKHSNTADGGINMTEKRER